MKSLGFQVTPALANPESDPADTVRMQAAGYNYINIDDCYSEKKRSASGDIVEGEQL